MAGQRYDINLHCMSYDVGSAKPDRRIFDAAEEIANQLVAAQEGAELGHDGGRAAEAMSWLKIYVGDEYEKDVLGARRAGWNPVFVDTEEDVPSQENLSSLNQLGNRTLKEVFPQVDKILEWRQGEEGLEYLVKWAGYGRSTILRNLLCILSNVLRSWSSSTKRRDCLHLECRFRLNFDCWGGLSL